MIHSLFKMEILFVIMHLLSYVCFFSYFYPLNMNYLFCYLFIFYNTLYFSIEVKYFIYVYIYKKRHSFLGIFSIFRTMIQITIVKDYYLYIPILFPRMVLNFNRTSLNLLHLTEGKSGRNKQHNL